MTSLNFCVVFPKVEEANELYKVCVTNVEERRNDLENTKREILAQLRKLVFQCDLTLKAVSTFFSNLKGKKKERVFISAKGRVMFDES